MSVDSMPPDAGLKDSPAPNLTLSLLRTTSVPTAGDDGANPVAIAGRSKAERRILTSCRGKVLKTRHSPRARVLCGSANYTAHFDLHWVQWSAI